MRLLAIEFLEKPSALLGWIVLIGGALLGIWLDPTWGDEDDDETP